MAKKKSLTYADAGVSIDTWSAAFKKIKPLVDATKTPGVLSTAGGFGGLFTIPKSFKHPVLVSSADGVGTKLKIAFMTGKHDTVGQDLVNHCVDDILVQGAKALFFMDYIGCGKLEEKVAVDVLKGFAKACKQEGVALLGGETAEMPGFYQKGEYDLSGFIVGVVDKPKLLTGKSIRKGDLLYGLPSTGLHTNGYSLARKIFFERKKWKVTKRVPELGTTIGEALLAVHKSYAKALRKPIDKGIVKGLAHITGGGFTENIPRILPKKCDAVLFTKSWDVLPIFLLMQKFGNIEDAEMHRTFNMGIGMVCAVSPEDSTKFEKHLKKMKEKFFIIGEVAKGTGTVRYV